MIRRAAALIGSVALIAALGAGVVWKLHDHDLEVAHEAIEAGDYTQAHRLLARWARVGDSTSEYLLGTMYALGRGVPRSRDGANRWFARAARSDTVVFGGGAGAYQVGVAFAVGRGVERDTREAAYWLARARDLGHRQAAARLQDLYRSRDEPTVPLPSSFEQPPAAAP